MIPISIADDEGETLTIVVALAGPSPKRSLACCSGTIAKEALALNTEDASKAVSDLIRHLAQAAAKRAAE